MNARIATLCLFLTIIYSASDAQPGTRDVTFGENGMASVNIGKGEDYPQTAVTLPDGRVMIAGYRTVGSGSTNIASIARCMADGSPDMSFGTGGVATISFGTSSFYKGALALQPDGRIIMTGTYWSATNSEEFVAARLNADGTLDESFGTDGKVRIGSEKADVARAVALQPDGKIVIGGYTEAGTESVFSQTGMQSAIRLDRLNADGTPDQSFGTAGTVITRIGQSDLVIALKIQQDGKIVAIGGSSNGTQELIAVARYNSDGSLDATFSGDGKATAVVQEGVPTYVRSMDILPDGGAVVILDSYQSSGYDVVITRLKSDGTIDSTFGTNGMLDPEYGVQLFSIRGTVDGKVVATGSKNDAAVWVARYNANGTPDNTFAAGGVFLNTADAGYNAGQVVELDAQGNIIVAVEIWGQQALGYTAMKIASNGVLDNSWGGDGRIDIAGGAGNDYLYNAVVLPDGRILVCGTSYNGQTDDLGYALFTPDGRLDKSFGTMGISTVHSDEGFLTMYNGSLVQPDGKIVNAGEVINYPVYKIALTRLTNDGTPDPMFGDNGMVTTAFADGDDGAYASALQSDGKIVITGYSLKGSEYDGIVMRYQSNGSVDSTFGIDGIVRVTVGGNVFGEQIALRPDGRIVVAGRTAAGSNNNLLLMQFNHDGSIDNSFGTNGLTITAFSSGDDGAYAMQLQNDGKIVVGGFVHPGSTYDAIVARFTADGKLDAGFGTNGRVNIANDAGKEELIGSLAIQADGKILASGYSGYFVGSGMDESTPVLVRLNADGSFDNSFGTNGRVVSALDGDYYGMAKLAIQPDGQIIAALPTILNNQIDFAPIRLQSGLQLGVEAPEFHNTTPHLYRDAVTGNCTLEYESAEGATMAISLIDMQGKTALVIQPKSAVEQGTHTVSFNTGALPRGAYILRMNNGRDNIDMKLMN
jgi:uncharacterized delta-60 repeat protein